MRDFSGSVSYTHLIILLSGIIGGAAGLIGSILGPLEILVVMVVNAPMTLGAAMFYLHVIRGEEAGVGDLFQGFSDFKRSFALMFLRSVYLFLWTLLLVIPGIIKSYSYAMSFYVLQDNPEMSASEAMNRSREPVSYTHLAIRIYTCWNLTERWSHRMERMLIWMRPCSR